MGGKASDWKEELGQFLAPFVARLGSQGAAADVSSVRIRLDRSWRSQEHSADGEAACVC
jgi:hypothetical protein